MIVKMRGDASASNFSSVCEELARKGFEARRVDLPFGTFLAGLGDGSPCAEELRQFDGVEWVEPGADRPLLVSARASRERTVVPLGRAPVGGDALAIIAGPCSVEDRDQIATSARFVSAYGATALRGGAYKPRTSPYAFQGLGTEGLRLLRDAGRACGLPVVTEVMEPGEVGPMEEYVDCFQIGARSMQNYPLLLEVGRTRKPVLIKRGPAASIKELLLAAEYVLLEGNPHVILCERGIKTFETATRNTLDLNAVPVIKSQTHLPVLVDPSHGTGRRDAVIPMARAAVAAGADGIIVEVHPDPPHALSDGDQSLTLGGFRRLVEEIAPVAEAVGRHVLLPAALPFGEKKSSRAPRTTGWGGTP